MTGFFPLQPNLSGAEPAGLFSFGRLAPGIVIFPLGFGLFFDSPRGDSGLPGPFLLGFRLPDLPGLFLGFGPCQVKGVPESSFFCKGTRSWPASARAPPTSALKPGNVLSVMIALMTWPSRCRLRSSARESRCLAGLRLVRTAGAGVDRVGSILQAHGDAALAALQKVIQGKALCGVDDHSVFLLCRRFPPGVPLFDFTARAGFPLCPWRHSEF